MTYLKQKRWGEEDKEEEGIKSNLNLRLSKSVSLKVISEGGRQMKINDVSLSEDLDFEDFDILSVENIKEHGSIVLFHKNKVDIFDKS